MPTDESAAALKQVEDIRRFCDFCGRLSTRPVTMPQDPVRAAGLDPEIRHGLGIVGLWAAIDAFAERRAPSPANPSPAQHPRRALLEVLGRKPPARPADRSLLQRVRATNPPSLVDKTMQEPEDMRHLYAHNFGGIADSAYFGKKRWVFKRGRSYALSSGTGTRFENDG